SFNNKPTLVCLPLSSLRNLYQFDFKDRLVPLLVFGGTRGYLENARVESMRATVVREAVVANVLEPIVEGLNNRDQHFTTFLLTDPMHEHDRKIELFLPVMWNWPSHN